MLFFLFKNNKVLIYPDIQLLSHLQRQVSEKHAWFNIT